MSIMKDVVKPQTSGTWVVIAVNCFIAVVGVLQGVDWVSVVGSPKAGFVAAVIAGVNLIAHYFTGPNLPQSR